MAEYCFEYKIEKTFGDEGINPPKLYFEKDYDTQQYSLYAVPEEWLDKFDVLKGIKDNSNAKDVRAKLHTLHFDEVSVVFDIMGVDCAPLADSKSEEYQKAEIKDRVTFEQFCGCGCKLLIERQSSNEHSGCGVLEMKRDGNTVARFFFAINFTTRKRITYTLDVTQGKVSLEFVCEDRPQKFGVRLVYSHGRLPCLRNDMNVNVIDTFSLDFSQGSACKHVVDLPLIAQSPENVFSVAIESEEMQRYYVLDCVRNTSLRFSGLQSPELTAQYSCPYCHSPIDEKLAADSAYKKGGVSCRGTRSAGGGKMLSDVLMKNKSKIKRGMYCEKDLTQEGGFKPDFTRLLPFDFLEHDGFKIAFAGPKRAGKTTFISRFFRLIGDGDKISMDMRGVSRSLSHIGADVHVARVPRVQLDNSSYILQDDDWIVSHKQYRDRSINLYPSRYPAATLTGDYTTFPFIAEVNGRAYISFYDIAGEDAQGTAQVRNIANGGLIGVFCIINGNSDQEGTAKVIEQLNNANLDSQTPIAVIVTKLDMLERDFDSNCRCLRTDYMDGVKAYEGSSLQYEIDYSSEEIRSYLQQEQLLPNFVEKYKNVKYFGISSFNFGDSIHNEYEDNDTPGKLKFECSTKRMELPFLWMLKQFGLIQ